jgi:hypothetical protein
MEQMAAMAIQERKAQLDNAVAMLLVSIKAVTVVLAAAAVLEVLMPR